MYKAVVHAEKLQKEKDKKKQRRTFVSYTVSNIFIVIFLCMQSCFCLQERTGVTAAVLRKRIGLPEAPHLKAKPKELEGAAAKEEVEELPEDLLVKPINLTESKVAAAEINRI